MRKYYYIICSQDFIYNLLFINKFINNIKFILFISFINKKIGMIPIPKALIILQSRSTSHMLREIHEYNTQKY